MKEIEPGREQRVRDRRVGDVFAGVLPRFGKDGTTRMGNVKRMYGDGGHNLYLDKNVN
jgi:hypothetical protein